MVDNYGGVSTHYRQGRCIFVICSLGGATSSAYCQLGMHMQEISILWKTSVQQCDQTRRSDGTTRYSTAR